MYAKQEKYSSQRDLGMMQSSMIWGSQWDQIMIWMKNVENKVNSENGKYYITNSIGMGNYGITNSGTNENNPSLKNTGVYKVKNIFDLSGNVYEWTLEGVTKTRIYRRRILLYK